tara:strand:+ start:751 stop:927 length:177 start_codon:yes stop_codon:yes gene_type:complete
MLAINLEIFSLYLATSPDEAFFALLACSYRIIAINNKKSETIQRMVLEIERKLQNEFV